jgi:hypothetical protein
LRGVFVIFLSNSELQIFREKTSRDYREILEQVRCQNEGYGERSIDDTDDTNPKETVLQFLNKVSPIGHFQEILIECVVRPAKDKVHDGQPNVPFCRFREDVSVP